MRDALLRHGVPEVSIEIQIGRPVTSGDRWNCYNFIAPMSHHIASRPTPTKPTPGLYLVKHGRSDLPGPLCNGTAGVDLVYRIICLGLANHPGEGGPITLSGPLGTYRIPEDNARAYAWGTEYEGGYDNATWDKVYTNKRTGKKMTFREFMGRANAGIAEGVFLINKLGKKPTSSMDLSGYHMEHKTWAPGRKVDRYGYSTASGRAEMKKYLTTYPPTVDLSVLQAAFKGKVSKPTNTVKRAQALLNKKVKPVSPIIVDGTWNPHMTEVYKKWQTKNGLKATGVPTMKDLTLLCKGTAYRAVA